MSDMQYAGDGGRSKGGKGEGKGSREGQSTAYIDWQRAEGG